VTSAGEGLLFRCRELLMDVKQLAEHAQAMRGGEVGRLRIAASPQLIQGVLAPFLTRYLKSRPEVDIELVEEGGAHTLRLVERGEAHLALAIRRGNDRLGGRLLFPFRVLAAMPPMHRLARRTIIDLCDLQGERVLLLRQGFGTREVFDAACRIARVHTRIVLEAGDPQSLIALVQAARGIAIVPSTVWFRDQTLRVAPILYARESLGMWGWVVWDPKRFLPAFTKSFIDRLVDYSRRLYPGRKFDRRAPPVPHPEDPPQPGD
jgi:DNA-binding transcriptional LysR family regulator